jgi:hypothetical protein
LFGINFALYSIEELTRITSNEAMKLNILEQDNGYSSEAK